MAYMCFEKSLREGDHAVSRGTSLQVRTATLYSPRQRGLRHSCSHQDIMIARFLNTRQPACDDPVLFVLLGYLVWSLQRCDRYEAGGAVCLGVQSVQRR